jgi:hypothetical protein
VKIGDIRTCTQEMIGGGGEVKIALIKLGPLICLMPTRIEHSGECSHEISTKAVNDTICSTCLILDVEMELFQVCGPLFMMVVLQLPLCMYEIHRLVISVDDCLLSQDVVFPLTTNLHNGIHFFVIRTVFLDGI